MSYSFSVREGTKAEAREKVKSELSRVVTSQPVHQADADQASAAAGAFIDLLRDDVTHDISVSVSGSISASEGGVNSANVAISASLIKKAS